MRAPSRIPWRGVVVTAGNTGAANKVVDGERMRRDGCGGRATRFIITRH